MKRIKNFNDFIIKEGLGTIIGKHDISYIADCILSMYTLYKGSGFCIKFSIDNKRIGIWTDLFGYTGPNVLAKYVSADNSIYLSNIEWDRKNLIIAIVHELTHALDPYFGTEKSRNTSREIKRLAKIWNDEPSIEGKKEAYKIYIKKYLSNISEIEAWSSQIAYVFNDLLCLYPEKLESARSEISKGNLDLSNIFSEWETLTDEMQAIKFSEKIRNKVLRKMAIICLNQKKGEQIKDIEIELPMRPQKYILDFLSNNTEVSKTDLPVVPFEPEKSISRCLIEIQFLKSNDKEKDSLRNYCKVLIHNAIHNYYDWNKDINSYKYTIKDVIKRYHPGSDEEDFDIKMWEKMDREKMIKISGLSDSDLNTKIWDLTTPTWKESLIQLNNQNK